MLHDRYKWTMQEMMDTDLRYLLDLIVVRAKIEDAPRLTPIDEVGIL